MRASGSHSLFRFFCALLFCGALCVLSTHPAVNPASPAPGGERIRVGYSRLGISLPIFAAQELGLFQQNGVNPELEMYENGQTLGQAPVEGNMDVGGYLALLCKAADHRRPGRRRPVSIPGI